MKDYQILSSSVEWKLIEKVNAKLAEGYLCLGGPYNYGDNLLQQAIYKPINPNEND